jgi:hypothetical protein
MGGFMEKSVTLRFYDVSRTSTDKPTMESVLTAIADMAIPEREKRVGEEEILVRLEDFESADSIITGQFIRGQSGNMPGIMHPDGTHDIPFQEPLGHGVAFRYRTTDGLLGIQFDSRILSPSRVMQYLYAHNGHAEWHYEPRLKLDAIDRFDEMPIRKLEMSVAGMPNPADADNPAESVWSSIAAMKERYQADTIRVTISRGHRGGHLLGGIKDLAHEAMSRIATGEVRALKALVDTGGGVPNEEIDLMGELFDVKEELTFPDRDFAEFYRLRKSLLASKIPAP